MAMKAVARGVMQTQFWAETGREDKPGGAPRRLPDFLTADYADKNRMPICPSQAPEFLPQGTELTEHGKPGADPETKATRLGLCELCASVAKHLGIEFACMGMD
jgi:hypothetical protein